MTERIDHTAEALRVISVLPSGDTLEQAYAYAQVHATLALVEQQRIANLIALASLPNDGRDRIDGEVFELIASGLHGLVELRQTPATPHSGPDECPALRGEIAAALGLTSGGEGA